MVLRYVQQVGLPKLAPHDLRRTCAKLCRAAGGETIQHLIETPPEEKKRFGFPT